MSPMGCHIPSHVTGLYVFAVINLTLLLNITFTEANILVWDRSNRTIAKIDHELEARFGPGLPIDGVWGHIASTIPKDGCSKIAPPPETSSEWIALIKRGACDFDIKVYNAQVAGYIAAIVFNNESDDLVPMGGGSKGDLVEIPSVFIGHSDAEYLYKNFDRSIEYSVLMDDESPFRLQLYLVPFAIVVAICFVLMLVFMVVKWIRDFNKRRRSRLSKSHLKKIPVKKFKKGDDYDICAICIDEYEEGEKLRILPCSHAYHQKCIDPWLTKNKKTCPICKRKVIPGRDGTSDSESDSDEENGNNPATETQPLLPAQDMRRGLVLGGASMGGTFDNSGLPENLRSHVMRLPDTSSDSDTDSDDSGAPPSSFQQSSVEVHSDSVQQQQAGKQQASPSMPVASYAVMDETDAVSEAASSVGIFGNGAETEEDEVAALLGAVGGLGTRALDISEDHFPSEESMADPLLADANDDEEQSMQKEEKEEVKVVSGKRNRRKKKNPRRRDEDA